MFPRAFYEESLYLKETDFIWRIFSCTAFCNQERNEISTFFFIVLIHPSATLRSRILNWTNYCWYLENLSYYGMNWFWSTKKEIPILQSILGNTVTICCRIVLKLQKHLFSSHFTQTIFMYEQFCTNWWRIDRYFPVSTI